MRNDAETRIRLSSLGRREFLRALGAGAAGAAGLGMLDPWAAARAAITPGEKGIYITDIRTATITGLNANCTVIRLDTNKGISGYGECRCEDQSSLAELRALKPTILGMNPTQVDRVFAAVKNYGDPFSHATDTPRHTGAMCAIECACWDITGKVYNLPVWKLLGRKLRDKVRMYCDTPQQNTISAMQSLVRTRVNRGFTWFKLDIQRSYLTSGTDYTLNTQSGYPYQCITLKQSGLDKWAQYVAACRGLIGSAPLSTDHYQNWASAANLDVPSAIALSNLMQGASYQGTSGGWMEDIIAWYYPEQLAQVKAGTTMPLLTGEDMYCMEELQPLVNAGGMTCFHPDQSTFGGLHQTRLAAEWAYIPDAILYPTGGGTGLIGMWKAFEELEQMGFIGSERPRMYAVQAEGCAPIVKAFNEGRESAPMWENATTHAHGLRVPKAIGDFLMLRALRASGGAGIAVSEAEIIQGVKDAAAAEGMFMAPEGGACVAALAKLTASGQLQPDHTVVVFNTGTGFKYVENMAPLW